MSAAAEVAREIAASTKPDETCRLLVKYAKAQPRGEGDDRVLVDALSARRARPYGLWLRLTALVDRLARMRGWS